MMHMVLVSLVLSTASLASPAQGEIAHVVIHPHVDAVFSCIEHPQGQFKELGDALGTDCLVVGGFVENGRPTERFLRPFAGDGLRNENWYGWGMPLLAPFDAQIERVRENPSVNSPGIQGNTPAGSIVFRRADGVRVLYAHIQKPTVRVGDNVKTGQAVAEIGNNGYSWSPHTHIAAWQGEQPLQIRFDLGAMGELRKARQATLR